MVDHLHQNQSPPCHIWVSEELVRGNQPWTNFPVLL